jgi:CubicO group peptidase (beta-lactamase class C family)
VTVILEGRVVVDLWGGWADERHTRPWREDTVVDVFSVGKALAALCVLMLVARGRVQLDAPLARYWPELVAREVTVRQLLSHQAGLAAIDTMLADDALFDWTAVTRALGEQEPWWEAGSAHGYHVHTFGFLTGELVRRVSGDSIGTFLKREVAGPLGADVRYGLAPADRGRRADYLFTPETTERAHPRPLLEERLRRLRERAYFNPPGATGLGTVNTVAWLDAELPSANLHASARGIAHVYAGLHDLLDADTLDAAIAEAACGEDLVLGRRSRFGLGFQLTQPERQLGPNARSFGHFGAGGALGFADPDAAVAFGYAMNRGGARWQNSRNRALIDALYRAL